MKHELLFVLLISISCSEFRNENNEARSSKVSLFKVDSVLITQKTSIEQLTGKTPKTNSLQVHINKLEISESGELDLLGKNIELNINELISAGAISSHGNGAHSSKNKEDSGDLKISIQKAFGRLELNLDGLDGADGANGVDGKFEEPKGINYSVLNGANGQEIYEDFMYGGPIFACLKEPENGKTPPSIDATDGRDGQDGGDSAQGFLKIINNMGFEVVVSNNYGEAGAGGKGGNSYSSPGGKAGLVDSKQGPAREKIKKGAKRGRCSAAKDGKPSSPGRNGVDGKNGADGKKKLFCIEDKKNKQCF